MDNKTLLSLLLNHVRLYCPLPCGDYGAMGLKLKWPNDIYYQDKKLAGILIKNTTRNQTQSVVIGIGVNIDVNIDCPTLKAIFQCLRIRK
jgi:biotin-(acetyl-CoA carboxylase) ligase